MDNKTNKFIQKAIKIHRNEYDYSKVNYINTKTKIIIICKEHGEFKQTPNKHLYGQGCKLCGIENMKNKQKSNTNEFIQRAIKIHRDKYDYSKVEYINAKIKIIIICKEHGEFKQTPNKHLSGCGCIKCSGNYQSNTEEFIQKAIKIHGNKYDYSKVNYIKNKNKVLIICKEHGEFKQTASDHLSNYGCNLCGIKNMKNKQISNTKEFIKKAKKIYGEKYDYSKVNYINAINKVIIICRIHGEFEQSPNSHLCGSRCSKCSGVFQYDSNEFIHRAKKVHKDKYDYSKVNYINTIKKVIIICKKHGEFKQSPNGHLSGRCCQKCAKQFSKQQIQWLKLLSIINNIYIQHAMNDGEFKIPTTLFKADGYCNETNTIYEFHGDYWHGNPKIFKPEEINKKLKKTHGELYKKTLEREKQIKDLGFNLVVIWESDFVRMNKIIKKIKLYNY